MTAFAQLERQIRRVFWNLWRRFSGHRAERGRFISPSLCRMARTIPVELCIKTSSKKLKWPADAVALHMAYYDYCWRLETLKGETPAMAAGLTNNVWSFHELLGA